MKCLAKMSPILKSVKNVDIYMPKLEKIFFSISFLSFF